MKDVDCEWCGSGYPACVKVVVANPQGEVHDTVALCEECSRRSLQLPKYIAIVFTTTKVGEARLLDDYDDALPFSSRCLKLELTERDLAKKLAPWAKAIAEQAGLDGKPVERYARLAKDCHNNPRLMLQQIDAGIMLS